MLKETNSITIGSVKITIGKNSSNQVANELSLLKKKNALIVTDQGIEQNGLLDNVKKTLSISNYDYTVFNEITADPASKLVEKGTEIAKKNHCDAIISVGGGSVMDAGKAIAMMVTNEGSILEYDNSPEGGKVFINEGLPVISIPTTSGTGSEVSPYSVITDKAQNKKRTIGGNILVSKVALIDPVLTLGLPKRMTAATGIDALAHAIEMYTSERIVTAQGSTIISDTIALEAIKLISQNLRQACSLGNLYEARKNVMLGSTMAGLVLSAGSGGAHGLGTPLGAHFHIPHGECVGMMLPEVMEFNKYAAPDRFAKIAQAMGVDISNLNDVEAADEAVNSLRKLLQDIDFPKLSDWISEKDIPLLVKDAVKEKCCQINTRLIKEEEATSIYQETLNQV
ncbi:iron-containing alcohol dehydrogenase [Enterococcus sp. DIV0187]|uniref:iron-containing alcohol dehydrogenase n=1 Tax=Enterococcus sp. DIV0187 TaxID=2774644 RepID=UPI003F229C2C